MIKVTLIVGLTAGIALAMPAPAHAETCAQHLAKRGTTAAADIEYHRIHGGESPCKGGSNTVDNSNQSDYNRDYHRSRWEDKTSFDCGWSWRGGFGC